MVSYKVIVKDVIKYNSNKIILIKIGLKWNTHELLFSYQL